MPFHGLRHPQLVGLETGKLLGIAEAGFHIPAAALAADQGLPLPREIIAHDVVQTSPAVRGHGEADISVALEVDSAYPSPGAARDTAAGKPSRQDAHRLGASLVGDQSIALERAHPDDPLPVQPLGVIPQVEDDVLEA